MRGSRVCGKEKWKRIGVAHWGPSGKRAARCGKCSVAWFMAIMMMMMRLRCTEKLQLIAYADPPPTPLPLLPSRLKPLFRYPHCPSHPPCLPFYAFKWNSHSTLLWQAFSSFDLLIHWVRWKWFESIQVYSSLFKSIHHASKWVDKCCKRRLKESLQYR